jgi:hypothetical protein
MIKCSWLKSLPDLREPEDAADSATQGEIARPIAKVVDALARRRVITVPEYTTTKRCSHCSCKTAAADGHAALYDI